MATTTNRAQIIGHLAPDYSRVLDGSALEFIEHLHQRFNPVRLSLLARRESRRAELDAGAHPAFLDDTARVRNSDWTVAPAPPDLERRRVEITGPVERKMMINALNSGADVFMADFEDALSPTWTNVIEGQLNLMDAVRRQLSYRSPDGKTYKLSEKTATLLVRPRGWHLAEKHVTVEGEPVSASLFDFGLYFFHNARELLSRGTGPYFYLPKMESHLEARLWNDVFLAAQDALGIPHGTIRATVLLETILAAFEMEEILYELRDHGAALNAGRWDYIFSIIKKFGRRPDSVLPDRAQVTMTVPFMRAYTELLVRACHYRGAHAIGGMAAFIPSRKDAAVNEVALARVREDKLREAGDGFDGTWVAHPDLVPVAMEIFEQQLEGRPHQKHRLREDVHVDPGDLVAFQVPGGQVSEQGFANNITVALQYLASWLAGLGAVGIFNLMEDTATAEISRAQLWQWIHHAVRLESGRTVSPELYRQVREDVTRQLSSTGEATARYSEASDLLDRLVLAEHFPPFLTLLAYDALD